MDRQALIAELERCRRDLHDLVDTATPAQLRGPTHGTAWTNEQLLFHMVFGFLIVRTLLPLVRLVSALPAPVGRGFAALLNASARPFHCVNYAGSCGGALVFNHRRMGWLCDAVTAGLGHNLLRESDEGLAASMPFPTRWDPYFTPVMTRAQVYAYPVKHYDHHRAQLTLARDS